jgi:hypothetical protein
VDGADIDLEPYYLNLRTPAGEKRIPYHRILIITYYGTVVFENRKIKGLAAIITGNAEDICSCGKKP